VRNRIWRRRLLTVLGLLWSVVVLVVYYRRVWRLFLIGPFAWVRENPSLASVAALWHLVETGPIAWRLPAFDEAAVRALTASCGAGLVLLAALILGLGVCQLLHWRPDNWCEGLLYRAAIGLGAISYLSLGLAALGLYYAANVQILIAVVLLGGGLWLLCSQIRSGFGIRKVKTPARSLSIPCFAQRRVWQAVALLAVLIAFVGALAPEIEYDALWYHLWLPRLWLEHGRPVDLVAEYVSLYPLTWELIYGAGLALGGPVVAKLLHFACLLLTGLLVYQFSRRYGAQTSPWLSVSLFVTVPTVLWEATTAYVDLALAFHTGLVVYALLRYIEGKSWQWLILGAINLGLALATKHLALLVLALAVSGLALLLWLETHNLKQVFLPAILLAFISFLFPLPWYIRNWHASGNPFFPEMFRIFGAFPAERWNAVSELGLNNFKAHFGRPRTAINLLTLPWDMTVHADRYGGTLGPMFLLLLPGLATKKWRSRIMPCLVSCALLYIAIWALPISSFQMRFLVPIVFLLAVLASEGYNQYAILLRSTVGRWGQLALQIGVAVLLLLNLPPFTSIHEGDRVAWDGWLTHVIHRLPISVVVGGESQEEYLSHTVPSYAAWQYINTRLPADARVLTFSGGDHFYSERERMWSDATIAYPATWSASRGQEGQALQALYKLGISHVLFDKQQIATLEPDALAIAQPSVLATWHLEYEDSRFALYQLR
jgi:hypothetical protein